MALSSDAGWRSSPLVGACAVVLAILAIVFAFTCRNGGAKFEGPPGLTKEPGIVLICPGCTHQFTVTAKDVADDPTEDYLIVKALRKPCPGCGKEGCVEALKCSKCGKHLLPYAAGARAPGAGPPVAGRPGGGVPRCPHCGKNPFTK